MQQNTWNQFYGTGVALVTPFKEDRSLDLDALGRLIDYCMDGGVDYLVVLGTTGEVATLTATEKKQVLQAAIAFNKKRLPLVYGLGGNNTQALLEEIKSTDFEGVDAILSVSPYYNKPSQAGIIQHYLAIADAAPVPVILYNVPGRTSSNLHAASTLHLAQHPRIIGIKEASGDLVQCMEIAANKPEDFLLISGDDMMALPMQSLGGVGVISVLANALPKTFQQLCHGDQENRKQAAFSLLKINPLMYAEGNPVGLKHLLALQGICGDQVRLPLTKASESLQEQLQSIAKTIKSNG